MNIAFAIEHFDHDQGGAEQYAWHFACWLVAQGHTLDVYTARARSESLFAGKIIELKPGSGPKPLAFASALAKALDAKKYDVVHGFNHVWPCDVLRLGGGVHLAFEKSNAQSYPTWLEQQIKRLSQKLLPRDRALRCNERHQFDDERRHFIAVSEKVARDMRQFYPACADRVRVIYNGVDTAKFNPDLRARRRAELKVNPDRDVLLFVSNNYRLKGLHDLIRALPLIKKKASRPVSLWIAGRGRSETFARLASKLGVGDQVTFCEKTPMMDLYASVDVLVHPSYYDAFGFVGIEAMACGLPVVISRNCGVSEIARDGDGAVLINMPSSSEQLAEAVLRSLEPVFKEKARDVNRRIAQQYPLEENYLQVLAVYEKIRRA